MSTTGGTLHGVWSSENVLSASDRRLKKDIAPLGQTLSEMRLSRSETMGVVDKASPVDKAAAWVLRELRPVSFSFRRGPESKFPRYGFVAQELERVLPAVVVEKDAYKHVFYQDLIALLTLSQQDQAERLEGLGARVDETEARVQALEKERLEARGSPAPRARAHAATTEFATALELLADSAAVDDTRRLLLELRELLAHYAEQLEQSRVDAGAAREVAQLQDRVAAHDAELRALRAELDAMRQVSRVDYGR